MPDEAIPELLRVLDLLGVLANAILGGGIARQHRLDPIGFASLAIFSGLGGGMLRDVLLQHGPPVALTDEAYLPVALAGAAIAFVLRWESTRVKRLGTLIDALALGCWAAVGSQKTLLFGFGWLPAVLLGAVTAVGGGAVRDVIVGQMPTIFGGNTLYATCAHRRRRRDGDHGIPRPWSVGSDCRHPYGRRFMSSRTLARLDVAHGL